MYCLNASCVLGTMLDALSSETPTKTEIWGSVYRVSAMHLLMRCSSFGEEGISPNSADTLLPILAWMEAQWKMIQIYSLTL